MSFEENPVYIELPPYYKPHRMKLYLALRAHKVFINKEVESIFELGVLKN